MLIKQERDKIAEDLGEEYPYGMSEKYSRTYGGDENKGIFLGPKKFRIDNRGTLNGPGDVRLYLTKDQALERGVIREEGQPIERRSDIEGNQGLYQDVRFSGGFISKVSIPVNQVSINSIDELIKNGGEKLDGILRAIASHYEDNTAPSHDVLLNLLQQATNKDLNRDQRRLSNIKFDNIDLDNIIIDNPNNT